MMMPLMIILRSIAVIITARIKNNLHQLLPRIGLQNHLPKRLLLLLQLSRRSRHRHQPLLKKKNAALFSPLHTGRVPKRRQITPAFFSTIVVTEPKNWTTLECTPCTSQANEGDTIDDDDNVPCRWIPADAGQGLLSAHEQDAWPTFVPPSSQSPSARITRNSWKNVSRHKQQRRMKNQVVKMEWDEWYQLLFAYRAEHRHLWIPQSYKAPHDGLNLGQWAHHQRASYHRKRRGGQYYNTIQQDRMKRLDAIGFRWDCK
jgi:Helicase associated domain